MRFSIFRFSFSFLNLIFARYFKDSHLKFFFSSNPGEPMYSTRKRFFQRFHDDGLICIVLKENKTKLDDSISDQFYLL